MSLGDRTQVRTQEIEFVYVLQTTSQKEICQEKRARRAKFVIFSFTYRTHCRRRHRQLRRCTQDLSTCVNV